MTKSDTMIHCLLTWWGAKYHCWLPKKYATIGNVIRIDGFDHNWTVADAWTELPTAVVLERSQDYKKTRKASDI